MTEFDGLLTAGEETGFQVSGEAGMHSRGTGAALRGGSALLAGVLGLIVAMSLVDTEAGGGSLTGPLIWMCLVGSLVLLLCAGLAFTRRVPMALPPVAALACLPLFVDRVAPSLVAWVSQAPASVVPDRFATFDPLAVGGLLAIGWVGLVHGRLAHRVRSNGRRDRG